MGNPVGMGVKKGLLVASAHSIAFQGVYEKSGWQLLYWWQKRSDFKTQLESLLSKTWESILEHSPREAARLQSCFSILPANGGRSWKSVICICKIHDALQEPWCFALNWLKWLPSIEIELLNRLWSEIELRLKLSCQWIEFEMKLNYHKGLHWHWISLNLIELTLNFIEFHWISLNWHWISLNWSWIEIELKLKLDWSWIEIE